MGLPLTVSEKLTYTQKLDGAMVLNLCKSPDDALYLYQVSRKYLIGFRSYSVDMICILKFKKGHYFENCKWMKDKNYVSLTVL